MDYAGEYGRKEDGAEDFQELQDGRDSHSPCAISVEGKQLFISAADEKLEILELQNMIIENQRYILSRLIGQLSLRSDFELDEKLQLLIRETNKSFESLNGGN